MECYPRFDLRLPSTPGGELGYGANDAEARARGRAGRPLRAVQGCGRARLAASEGAGAAGALQGTAPAGGSTGTDGATGDCGRRGGRGARLEVSCVSPSRCGKVSFPGSVTPGKALKKSMIVQASVPNVAPARTGVTDDRAVTYKGAHEAFFRSRSTHSCRATYGGLSWLGSHNEGCGLPPQQRLEGCTALKRSGCSEP